MPRAAPAAGAARSREGIAEPREARAVNYPRVYPDALSSRRVARCSLYTRRRPSAELV